MVQLLLYESEKVIRKIEVEIQREFYEKSPENLKQRYANLKKKYFDLKSKLEERRRKKWKKFKGRNNALNNIMEILTGVGGSNVPSSVSQLSTISQSENVSLVESAITTLKQNESSNITGTVDNICTSSGIKMTEAPDIDNVLLKVKSIQGRVNESFIMDNRTLRKKKQKCKAMNVASKMDKSVVENNMKNEEKIETVGKTRSKSYADAVWYDQNV